MITRACGVLPEVKLSRTGGAHAVELCPDWPRCADCMFWQQQQQRQCQDGTALHHCAVVTPSLQSPACLTRHQLPHPAAISELQGLSACFATARLFGRAKFLWSARCAPAMLLVLLTCFVTVRSQVRATPEIATRHSLRAAHTVITENLLPHRRSLRPRSLRRASAPQVC